MMPVRASLALNPMGSIQRLPPIIPLYGGLRCVGTAFRLYKQMGEPLYCETMRLIVATWEGKPDSFRASVLRGMMHFVELYHGEFSEERLIRALRNIHPVDIYRIGQDDPAKLRGWKKYVFPIYTAYNGKCRKDTRILHVAYRSQLN